MASIGLLSLTFRFPSLTSAVSHLKASSVPPPVTVPQGITAMLSFDPASAEDVIELMLAGATAIGVGAANLVEPYACKTIIENLPAVMERYGMENLTEIIGGAHHG